MFCRKIVILGGDGAHCDCKGILTLTRDSEGVGAKLTLRNLSPAPVAYALAVRCGEAVRICAFEAAEHADIARPLDLPLEPSAPVCALVGVAATGKPVLYGSDRGTPLWESGLPRALATFAEPAPAPQPPPQPQKQRDGVEKTTPQAPPARALYDDEAIADADYYPAAYAAYTDGPKRALGREAAAGSTPWADYERAPRPRLARRPAPQSPPPPPQRDARAETRPYYKAVAQTLDTLFASAERERALNDSLPGTDWARVRYRDGLYYCVGRIGGTPDAPEYIGYAVPGEYSRNPPRQFDGLCKWLPLSAAAPRARGYWLMFQDAADGATVRL